MDRIEELAHKISERLRRIGIDAPRVSVIGALLRTVHTASLIPEEGQFIRGSVTLADPREVDGDVPRTRRADYPAFTKIDGQTVFSPASFAKLARAVDRWCGSVAVWGTSSRALKVWGIVDQLVGTNMLLYREGSGFGNPGLFTVVIERPGDFTAYHSNIFLGALRSQTVVLHEVDALQSTLVMTRVEPYLADIALAIYRTLPGKPNGDAIRYKALGYWAETMARICLGLRRIGSGGALLISPKPKAAALSFGNRFAYSRLRDSLALRILDEAYQDFIEARMNELSNPLMKREEVLEIYFAQTDFRDRENEVNGAVKLASSLAAIDGVVVLTPDLNLVGFGVKITSSNDLGAVYDGEEFSRKGKRAKKIDISGLGTRHSSVLRYCRSDPNAIGIIVSQDGHVRVAMSSAGSLLLWDRIQLLRHTNYSAPTAASHRNHIARVRKIAETLGRKMGYSPMPKTFAELMAAPARKRRSRSSR